MKPFWVYMLRCRDNSYYVGHTDDLELRMAQHHDGTLGGYTSRRRPVELVWSQKLDTRDEALQREMQLEGWSRAKKGALARGDWSALKLLARGTDRHVRSPFDFAQGERTTESRASTGELDPEVRRG
jgi:predicted GIY-YIG superfamily endonuclease